MKKHIKSIAAFCAMTMIFGMFSATAFAGNEEPASNDPAVVENLDDTQEQATPAQGPEITQTSINANGKHLPVVSGTYTLMEDVTVESTAQIETNDAQITINLNGHTITYTGTESMYIVGKLRGINADGTGVPDANKTITGVTLTIEGPGTITGEGTEGTGSKDYWLNGKGVGIDAGRGGCILVEWNNTCILDGATITGFEANDEGGAVLVSNGATFVMNGGAITNCYAGKGGGGISGNASSAQNGPSGENLKASVTINGGTISGNEAGQLGGGVRINRCHFYLNGGEITNNNVLNATGINGGGGIQILHGNGISHNVLVQGSPKVYGNKANGSVNVERANILLNGCTITLGGALSDSAKLGFSSTQAGSNCFNINGKSYSLNSFVCDHENYIAYVSSGYIKMKAFTMPKVSGYNIGISGEILFKVYVNFGQAAQSDVSINYTYSYKKTGSNEVVFNKDVTEFAHNDNGYYFVIPVQSACMTSPITITLTYQGKETEYTTTVEEVAYDSVEQDASYENLVKALLTYGGYAQIQLKINTGKLPVVAGVDFSQDFSPAALTPQEYNAGNDAFDGAVLSLLSETNIKLSFKKSVLGDTAPTMTVAFGSGSYTLEGTSKGNDYVYTIKGSTENSNGFPATAYNSTFTYSFESGISGEYSIFTYLQVAKAKGSNAMKNLAEAYFNFALECEAIAG